MPAAKTTTKNEKTIKYTDKSAGQPDLLPIFDSIKKILQPYIRGTIKEKGNQPGSYHLWSEKKIEVAGRKMDEVYFAGLMVQKGFVGFYFMPVYADPALKNKLKPELLKTLKGKSCFHIKKNDSEIVKQIKDALKEGYNNYKEKGWV